jgi:hypothetical protein
VTPNRTGHAQLRIATPDLELVPSFKVLHSSPGRLRIHIPDWTKVESTGLEHRMRAVMGVEAVRVNRQKQNVLIWYGHPPGAMERVLWLVDAVMRSSFPHRP